MVGLRYAYGSMALTESALVLWTLVEPRSWRLFLVDFLVRMWRLNACERLMLPFARTRKRFLAPLLVFIFGMTKSLSLLFAAHSGALRGRGFLAFALTGLGLIRVMLGYGYFFRGQQHHHLPPLEPRKLLHDTMRLQVAADTLQQPDAEFLMRHFPPAKAQRDLGFVTFA